MGRGVVAEFEDPRVAFERGLHDSALDATAAPVNHAHLTKSSRRGGVDVLGDDRGDIAWRETVKVELGADWYSDWEVAHNVSCQLSAFSSWLSAISRQHFF